MIIVMQAGTAQADLDRVVSRVEALRLRPHVIVGTERTVVAVVGDERDAQGAGFETLPGVASVLPILAPYKVASREVQSEPTVVRAGPLVVGGGRVGVIAGPCSVESREQIVQTARAVKEAGALGLPVRSPAVGCGGLDAGDGEVLRRVETVEQGVAALRSVLDG
ncbi:MAG: 3-deoxy-7-phosphoheptulonate synthase, partial [Planctomycetia bacterium]